MENIEEVVPYPADPAQYLEQMEAILPFFSEETRMFGYLAMMAYEENRRQKEWIYTLEYYGGKWIMVRRRNYVYEFEGKQDVVRRDSDATTAVSLAGAIASMRAAAMRPEK